MLRQRVSSEKEWGERESEPRERREWERASVREGRKESEREGGERRDHVLPQRPRGAEDTFIMHRASEPAEPRGGYRRSTLPKNIPAPRMRRSVRIAASRSSKVARLQPRGDNDGTDLITLIRWIETWAGNDTPFPSAFSIRRPSCCAGSIFIREIGTQSNKQVQLTLLIRSKYERFARE